MLGGSGLQGSGQLHRMILMLCMRATLDHRSFCVLWSGQSGSVEDGYAEDSCTEDRNPCGFRCAPNPSQSVEKPEKRD